MANQKFPVKVTRKGTKKFTVARLREQGYEPEQAERMAAMDIDNELPRKAPKRGRLIQGHAARKESR